MRPQTTRTMSMIIKGLALLVLIPLFLFSLQYLSTEIYTFSPNRKFQGDSIYNPYEKAGGTWLRANFHTHSRAWKGITPGGQAPNDVYKHYYDRGYDVISLSNYQHITQPFPGQVYIPTYEHGFNLKKQHHIVLDAHQTSFSDFSLLQSTQHKQKVLKSLKRKGGLIVLAHPKIRHAFSVEDMERLTGYDFIELVIFFQKTLALWDAALSSGHLCWIMANDDSHDVYNGQDTFVRWTMVGSSRKVKEGILAALKSGCHYGVRNELTRIPVNTLDSSHIVKNQIYLFFRHPADQITWIGDHGHIIKTAHHTRESSVLFEKGHSYLRAEVRTGPETLYLNPFIRFDGHRLPYNEILPPVDRARTMLFRILILLIASGLLMSVFLVSGNLQIEHHRFRWVRIFRRRNHRINR